MTRAWFSDIVIDPDGKPIPTVTVDVFEPGTTTPIAGPIYATATNGSTLANPFTTNSQGELEFWLATPKRVDLRYSKSGEVTETHTIEVLASTPPASSIVVAPTGAIAATDVQAALAELDTEKSATTHNHSGTYAPHVGYYASEYGVVADGVTNQSAAINAAMAAAGAAGHFGEVIFPPGKIAVGAKITLLQGVAIRGGGPHDSASRPGTEFVPASGYTGVCFEFPDDGVGGLWHNAGIRRLRVAGFASHGIHILGGMGETSTIDEVLLKNNGGDGLRIEGPSTPLHLGHISVHANTGAGIRLVSQTAGHNQILYVGGDNNGESLVTVDTSDSTTTMKILGWKAERYNPSPGHPNIFVINNGNGAFIDLGPGRIHIGSATALSSGASIRQTGTTARVKITAGLGGAGSGTSYTDGYKDVGGAVTFTVTDVLRNDIYIGAPPRFLSPLNEAALLVGPSASSPGIYTYTGNPENVITANPSSICLATTGAIYKKVSGTGNTGWRQMLGVDFFGAKGSLLVGATGQAGGNFSVGADGKVLVADSAQSFGLLWRNLTSADLTDFAAALAAAVPALAQAAVVPGGYLSGQYYGPVGSSNATRSYTADGQLRIVPYYVRSAATFDRFAIETTAAGSAGTAYRLGIWNHDATRGLPGTLLLDAGTVVGDAAAGAQAKTISQALTVGWVWLGVAVQSFGGSPIVRGVQNGISPFMDLTQSSGTSMNGTASLLYTGKTGAFGTLASDTPATSTVGPAIALRAA